MDTKQQNWVRGQFVLWLHNGQTKHAQVIETSLRQIKIRLLDSADIEEYWVAADYIRARD